MKRSTSSLLIVSTVLGLAAIGCGGGDDAGSASSDVTAIRKPKQFPPNQLSEAKNYKLWSSYCIGDKEVTQKPQPNYKNDIVNKAAANLSKVAGHSFAMYSDIKKHHLSELPADLAGKYTQDAHDFLTYTCGEFRDRATMVEAKIKWAAERFNYLDNTPGSYDPKGNPWMQMKQDDYEPYLAVSSALFNAKDSDLSAQGKSTMQIGSVTADTPVPPQSVCETKYMFAEYVKKGKSFDSLAQFKAGYETFKTQSCTLPADEDYFYDFRGDSNLKPNSPESNAMIWVSRTITRQCDSKKGAAPYQQVSAGSNLPVDACREYFKYPFASRWNAARAGLAAWILVDPARDGLDSNQMFTVIPRSVADEGYVFGDIGPYKATDYTGKPVDLLANWKTYWKKGGLGLRDLLGGDNEKVQRAIGLAVDRHTDWYASAYDDQMAIKSLKMTQAFSPFVASSYEMSKSDMFVSPGITVQSNDPTASQWKHWMFVFKVAKKNWYNPENVARGESPDFDKMWLDETSFGDTGLANSERAWDRMGTALEDELEAMLYLHNIPH